MSFIVLEGLDRTGKSTVAELYKKQGYEVVHLSAPDKKYTQDGYAGPSYLDDLLELIMQYDGKDVVWDRSWYGEFVWPHVYGRAPMLTEDDIEVLQEFEDRNNTQRILMIDPNTQAHWERCVANSEPLNQHQFKVASALFNKMAHKYNFIPQQLGDFDEQAVAAGKDTDTPKEEEANSLGTNKVTELDSAVANNNDTGAPEVKVQEAGKTEEQEKLEKANAINSILSKRIVRQKGVVFDRLETDIKVFLQQQLSVLLGSNSSTSSLSDEEVQILKLYCQRIKDKQARG